MRPPTESVYTIFVRANRLGESVRNTPRIGGRWIRRVAVRVPSVPAMPALGSGITVIAVDHAAANHCAEDSAEHRADTTASSITGAGATAITTGCTLPGVRIDGRR